VTNILKYQGQVVQELSGLIDPEDENMMILAKAVHSYHFAN